MVSIITIVITIKYRCALVLGPSVRSQRKISELARQFFQIICMKLDGHEARKLTKLNFWKKVPSGQEDPKKSQKWGFWGFDKGLIHSFLLFFTLIWKFYHISRKNLVRNLRKNHLCILVKSSFFIINIRVTH